MLASHINPTLSSDSVFILSLLPSGASASELVLQCTPEGIRLQCYMNYYTEEMKTIWKHKYALRRLADRACGRRRKSPSWVEASVTAADVLTLCPSVVKGE